jgi:anti-sigma B factor antagonist
MANFGKSGSEGLAISCETRDTALIITPTGDIDLNASPTLRQELKKAQTSNPKTLVINLAQVPYMDSSGVATLVEAMQAARRGNTRLILCSLQDRVRSIFEIARLNTVFTIVDDTETALK